MLFTSVTFADVLDGFTQKTTVSNSCTVNGAQTYKGATLQDCAGACYSSGCQGFIFYPTRDLSLVNCSLRGSSSENCKEYNDPANFYVKYLSSQDVDTGTGQSQRFIYTADVDCNGSDIQPAVNSASVDDCAVKCLGKSECVAFSYGSSRCSLKKFSDYCDLKLKSGYVTYQKFGAPFDRPIQPALSTCTAGDDKCMQQIRNQGFDDTNSRMYVYPRITRDKNEVEKKEGDATKIVGDASTAVLLQTSYLARVMIQANDVFPPSHVSSRTSGETYLSSTMPYRYNLKTLTESSITRSTLGSENASGNATSKGELITLARDWVEYHMNNYCDPLAARLSMYNCSKPTGPASTTLKNNGVSTWDAWKSADGQSLGSIAFAEDINANTLLQANIQHPEAAMRYIYNVTNNMPTPLDNSDSNFTIPEKYIYITPSKQKVLKSEGYNVYMGYLEKQAKTSLSQYALMKIFAEHMQLSSVTIPVTKWTDKGKVTEYKPTSRQGLLEFEATKRFSDPSWYDRVQQMPTPALLKEIAYMQALQLTLEYKRYEQQQIQIAQFASFASELAAMASMAKDMAKNNDPAKVSASTNDALKSLGITPPAAGTKVDFNSLQP